MHRHFVLSVMNYATVINIDIIHNDKRCPAQLTTDGLHFPPTGTLINLTNSVILENNTEQQRTIWSSIRKVEWALRSVHFSYVSVELENVHAADETDLHAICRILETNGWAVRTVSGYSPPSSSVRDVAKQ